MLMQQCYISFESRWMEFLRTTADIPHSRNHLGSKLGVAVDSKNLCGCL
jgi:hypothetical protein